ncbi:hypothetical protein [Spongiimicrobium salis]|uniref:hypothetical protein n=1 Tax=Spongiimicrobium salis TaxID=1667022 RepID=UPI00374DE2D8
MSNISTGKRKSGPKLTYYFFYIKKWFLMLRNWFWALPMFQRALISSIAGAFFGSTVVGFLNTYALYWHAYRNNFRIPVEGVEYLTLAISIFSFMIMIVGIAVTILVYWGISKVHHVFNPIFKFLSFDQQKYSKLKYIFPITIIYLTTIIYAVKDLYIDFKDYSSFNEAPFKIRYYYGAIILYIGTFLVILSIWLSQLNNKLITMISTLFFISLVCIGIFFEPIYNHFLSSIKYGGKIPIAIEYRAGDNREKIIKGILLLKTEESIIYEKNQKVEEIPANRVSRIRYE